MEDYREVIDELISKPEKLITYIPFTRGGERNSINESIDVYVSIGERKSATLPTYMEYEVSQDQFRRELDPNCHDVLFDENIPSFCIKLKDGGIKEIKNKRVSIPIQRELVNKQTMHLAAKPMQFTLVDIKPSKKTQDNFITFKQYWKKRNQDGMKFKMVSTQLSYGDVGLLYYINRKGEIKSRILSYEEGYKICSHNDCNGERLIESVYHAKNGIEYINSWDDTYVYRHEKKIVSDDGSGWKLVEKKLHGFSEIPLVTKRGNVAWNNVQPLIESYEELKNVFNAVQKRSGKGLLYIKGKFKDGGKMADGFILNDTDPDGKGDAKYLTPPSPQGMIETMNSILDDIQLGASTTFLLPKDIKTGGDISGITMKLVQSIDIENAMQKVVEWQNVADKMARLFKEGLSKELVNKGENLTAVTDFENLDVNAQFDIWIPLNEYEYNQMLTILTGAGILSKESGIELNTASKPDEKARIMNEIKEGTFERSDSNNNFNVVETIQNKPII